MYIINALPDAPPATATWTDAPWADLPTLTVDQFRSESSSHRPVVQARLGHVDRTIHLLWRVEDRYVRCVHTERDEPVCRDSCVEFFFEPRPGQGYLNLEVNCGGAFLIYFIKDHRRDETGAMADRETLPEEVASQIRIATSLPKTVEPERDEPVTWTCRIELPVAVAEHFLGPLGELAGQQWRANFYKCADDCSHPHWASWATVEGKLNFHQPEYFAPLLFA
jgi:hypothetical protein